MKTGIAILAIVAVLSGCTDTPQKTDASASTQAPVQLWPNWPTLLNDFRFHWTAAPDIDLAGGPAVVVRAYTESFEVASMTFNIDDVYPGFMRATPENQPRDGDYREELIGIRPLWPYDRDKPPPGVHHFGLNTDHLLELTPTGDGYRAVVCTGWYSNFIKSTVRPDTYYSVESQLTKDGAPSDPYAPPDRSGVSVRQIDFTRHDPRIPADAPASVLTPQRGPVPAPQVDVFGNWFVTASSTFGWGPAGSVANTFPTAELRKRCNDAMPHNEAQRGEMMTGYKNAPPPHGNAVPGWPFDAK